MKKIISLILIGIFVVVLLAACGENSASTVMPTTTPIPDGSLAAAITQADTNNQTIADNTTSPANDDEQLFWQSSVVRVNNEDLFDPVGKYVLFGSYPQSIVTDDSLTAALFDKAGSIEDFEGNKWIFYNYTFSSSTLGTYIPMRFQDIEYGGEYYRGVYIPEYRTYNQEDNGYTVDNYYWFKYEPIKWYILSEEDDSLLLLSERVLDSNCFCNRPYKVSGAGYPVGNGGYYTDSTLRYFASNYAHSTIRSWLHSDFYDTAFSENEKDIIIESEVDNSAAVNYSSINDPVPSLFSGNTMETVYFLSYSEASAIQEKNILSKEASDYAKCQGVSVAETSNCSPWWLRTVISPYVTSDGSLLGGYVDGNGAAECDIGVVPVVKISI